MIDRFIARWDNGGKAALEAQYAEKVPDSYQDIFRDLITILSEGDGYEAATPDPERITVVNHGDYQGTLIFTVGEKGYQPSRYWYCRVYYGSCSGCDTFEAIRGYRYDAPAPPEEIQGYITLALHMLQEIEVMYPDKPY